jgi:hypothetical protein
LFDVDSGFLLLALSDWTTARLYLKRIQNFEASMTYLQTFILVFTALIIAMGNLFIPRYFDRQQELRDRSADCVTYRHYAQSYEVDVAKTGEFYMAKGDCTRIFPGTLGRLANP